MRKSLILTGAALLFVLPSLAIAQTSGAGDAGVGNADSTAGAPGNIHSGPNAAGQKPGSGLEEGRSSSYEPATPLQKNKVGDMPSSSESMKGNNSGAAHDSE